MRTLQRRASLASLRARVLLALAPTGLVAVPVAGCSTLSANIETNEPGQPTSTAPTGPTAPAPSAAPTTPSAASGGPTALSSCEHSSEECFTHDQLVDLLENPPRGGSLEPIPGETRRASFMPGDPSAAAQWDKNGCLPPRAVHNGCCNPAEAGPAIKDGKCCYTFCEGSCCGRPLVVDGAPRVSALRRRDDWSARAAPVDRGAFAAIDPSTREALARAWSGDARMEHASVASFARFALELLAVGAPADLVAAAHRAAQDEIRHAAMCFEIASRFAPEEGGAQLGPAELDVRGVRLADGLPAIVAGVVREGCVGETLAALLASEAASGATDAATRAALLEIAADEASHAELAWRFLRWAIAEGGDATRDAAARAFEGCQRDIGLPAGPPEGADLVAWRAHGRLEETEARAVALDVMREIVRPAAAAALSV